MRDGKRYDLDSLKSSESFDLVVVGAGISGLAAAWFWRKQRPNARILVLDNHEDFGGHAARNEFTVGGRRLISYGGSESLQSPADAVERHGEGTAQGPRRRPRALRDRVRPLALSRARPVARHLLHAGGLRQRQARDRRPDADGRRRHPARSHERPRARRVRRRLPALRRDEGAAGRALHVDEGSARRHDQGEEGGDARQDELSRLARQGVEARRRRGQRVPGPHARLLRRRHRRRHRARRLRHRLPRLRRHRHPARRAPGEGDGRAVHPPLPRRQRLARAADGAQARAGRRAGQHDGGHRHRAVRLREARRPRRARARAPVVARSSPSAIATAASTWATCATAGSSACARRRRSWPATT